VLQQLLQRMLHHGARDALHSVQRGYDGHGVRGVAQQLDDILAAVPAVDAVLVLQQHSVIALRTGSVSCARRSRQRP
jgi:hypothetical protein